MTIERRDLEVAGLKAHFYAPKTGGKLPTLIAVHGGGWRLLNLETWLRVCIDRDTAVLSQAKQTAAVTT